MIAGLLMVADENDILERVLSTMAPMVDAFYVLDGSSDPWRTEAICARQNFAGLWRDSDLPHPPYPHHPVDGYRQWLLERIYDDHGHDVWVALLHGDEVWESSPADAVARNPGADALLFRLPVYFPREPWLYGQHPLDQLKWNLRPGWPELRLFHGGAHVRYARDQHFNVTPHGLRAAVQTGLVIRHYPYRSPPLQRARALRHVVTGFDPDNYRHILDRDEVLWSDEMIAAWQRQACWSELRRDE